MGSFVIFAMRSSVAAASRAKWLKRDTIGHPTPSRRGKIQGPDIRSEFGVKMHTRNKKASARRWRS